MGIPLPWRVFIIIFFEAGPSMLPAWLGLLAFYCCSVYLLEDSVGGHLEVWGRDDLWTVWRSHCVIFGKLRVSLFRLLSYMMAASWFDTWLCSPCMLVQL